MSGEIGRARKQHLLGALDEESHDRDGRPETADHAELFPHETPEHWFAVRSDVGGGRLWWSAVLMALADFALAGEAKPQAVGWTVVVRSGDWAM